MLPTTGYHDYYAVMEIPQSAGLATIKTAYRRLARAKHPDKQGGTDAEFKLVSLTALLRLKYGITNAVT
jgi:DnaJ-class molecular chaperone